MQRAQPVAQQQDWQIAGVIEEFLRQMRVEQKRVIDDKHIHVGNAPKWKPEAGDQKRDQHAGEDDEELTRPSEPDQAIERLCGVADANRLQQASGAGHESTMSSYMRGENEESIAPYRTTARLGKHRSKSPWWCQTRSREPARTPRSAAGSCCGSRCAAIASVTMRFCSAPRRPRARASTRSISAPASARRAWRWQGASTASGSPSSRSTRRWWRSRKLTRCATAWTRGSARCALTSLHRPKRSRPPDYRPTRSTAC